jgi:Cu+-exporting ATPase
MAKDPVCGMDVDEKAAASSKEHDGTTYYFCGAGCLKQFEENPGKYSAK